MPFTLGGNAVQFDTQQFKSLVEKAGGTSFQWKSSSMGPLHNLATAGATGPAMRTALGKLTPDKATKYKDAVKYLVYHYPGLVTANELTPMADPRVLGVAAQNTDFQTEYAATAARRTNHHPILAQEFGDIIYGAHVGRQMNPYQIPGGMICDKFNNAAEIGTGMAYNRQWSGLGFLDATPNSVRQTVQTSASRQGAISQPAMTAYTDTLFKSRYSPETAFHASKADLKKDLHKPVQFMKSQYGYSDKEANAHAYMHARFVKSVRRACKGGIAMLATAPGFRAVQANILFILDGLGDLGEMAFKIPRTAGGDYVAITTSELSFSYRYWNHSKVPLNRVVKFWVNGAEVNPPWDAEWTQVDAAGNNVYSNREAWVRVKIFRALVTRSEKSFPVKPEEDD